MKRENNAQPDQALRETKKAAYHAFRESKVTSRVIHPQCQVERFEAVCLRFIVDRERLGSMFRTSPTWMLDAHFSTCGVHFAARLTQAHGVRADTWKKSVAMGFATALRETPFHVVESQRTSTPQRPPPPFVAATLIQPASGKLRLPEKPSAKWRGLTRPHAYQLKGQMRKRAKVERQRGRQRANDGRARRREKSLKRRGG